MTLTEALTIVAPFYNMGLVLVAIFFFIKLFWEAKSNAYLTPWKVMFAATMIFVVEEVLTILRQHKIIMTPFHINGFFELMMVALVIYLLLLQKQYTEKFVK